MNLENTIAQMRKGVLEYCILSILKNGEAYPSDILVKLKKSKRNIVSIAYSLKKFRSAYLSMGRIKIGTST